MIYVISKSTFGDYNVRDIQCNANWDCCPYSDYALIPDSLVDGVLATKGYCDIVLTEDGGAVASFTAREIPSVPEECCGENTVLSVNGKTANTVGEVRLSADDVGAVDNAINRGDWKAAGKGVSYWKYEVADTVAMDLPTESCFVVVIKESEARGTAIAYDWLSGHYNMWRNSLHDDNQAKNWSGWKNAAESIGAVPTSRKINGQSLGSDVALSAADVGAIPTDPTIRTQIPAGADIKAFFSNIDLPFGYYYYYPETAPVNAPNNNANDWWFFNRTPAGVYAHCAGEPNRKWVGTNMNSTFYGWDEISVSSHSHTPESIGAQPALGFTPAVGVGQISDDANTATTSGLYRIQEAANVPNECTYGQLVVAHGGGDTISQLAFNHTTSKMWVRTGNSLYNGVVGNWGAWKRVITEDSFSYSNGTLTITI